MSNMKKKSKVFKIYLPLRCISESNAILVGCMDPMRRYCCIMGCINSMQNFVGSPDAQCPCDLVLGDGSTIGIVGVWNSTAIECEPSQLCGLNRVGLACRQQRMLAIHRTRTSKLRIFWVKSNTADCIDVESLAEEEFLVLFVDFCHFGISAFLVESKTDSMCMDVSDGGVNVRLISQCIRDFASYVKSANASHHQVLDLTTTSWLQGWMNISSVVQSYIIFIISHILRSLVYICSNRVFLWSPVSKILSIPAVTRQLRGRYDSVQQRLSLLPRYSSLSCNKLNMRFANIICTCMIDVCLGVALMVWLLRSNKTADVSFSIITWAEMVASECERLLHWMMGVPAGLKLNEPLDHFLGNFFLYHIYLWKAYLKALQPFWIHLLEVTCLTGCLGLSVQLSVIQDLLSMMTLHIYCFYVYAARLYSLQLYALSSLWRLFCGKKWNVLRNRVDSAKYDVDQLFTGTLLFTILLFLLPTTLLYYSIFALLRVVVLIAHGVIYKVVAVVNNLSIYWLLLRVFAPSTVACEPRIRVVQQHPLCLLMELQPAAWSELLQAERAIKTTEGGTSKGSTLYEVDNSWKSLCTKLLLGQLIYPWIEKTQNSS